MNYVAREVIYLCHLCKELCFEAITYLIFIIIKGDNKFVIITADLGVIIF